MLSGGLANEVLLPVSRLSLPKWQHKGLLAAFAANSQAGESQATTCELSKQLKQS